MTGFCEFLRVLKTVNECTFTRSFQLQLSSEQIPLDLDPSPVDEASMGIFLSNIPAPFKQEACSPTITQHKAEYT